MVAAEAFGRATDPFRRMALRIQVRMQALVDPRSLGPSSPDPLAEEIRGVLAGDRAATRRLCVELGPVVVKTLRRLLGAGHPDLDDLLQDTLIGVLDGLPRFRGGSSLR